MTNLEKLWVKICDKLYTSPPERLPDGRKKMKVHFEYCNTNVLNFTVDRLCKLKMNNVSERIFQDYIDYQFEKVNWVDYKAVAGLCLWFNNRGCEATIAPFYGTWFENQMSEAYLSSLKNECNRQSDNQK